VGVVALVTWRVRVYLDARNQPAAAAPPAEVVPAAPPAEIAQANTAAPAAVQAPEATSAAPLVIELDVSADCWISLAVDGASPVSRLFGPGDQQRLEVTREVLLDVGNAGGVRLIIDGRPAKPLGATGARVRTRITRDNAREFLE
jgi:hypothetical protein